MLLINVAGKAVAEGRALLKPTSKVNIKTASTVVDFGATNLNLTLEVCIR